MTGYTAVSNVSGPISYLRHQCELAGVLFKFDTTPRIDDPTGSQVRYWFRNNGKKLVRIVAEGRVHFLEPTESIDVRGSADYDFPEVESLNNGL